MIIALLIIFFVVGLLPFLIEIKNGSFSLFNLKNPFIVYFIIQIGVSGCIAILAGEASPVSLDPVQYVDAYEKAFIASILGLLAFYLGYYLFGRNIIIASARARVMSWATDRYKWVSGVYLLIGMMAFILLIQSSGGLLDFIRNRDGWRAGGLVGQGYLMYPSTTLLSIAAMVYLIGSSTKTTRSNIARIMVIVSSLIPAFYLGFRSVLVLPLIQYFIVWHYRIHRFLLRQIIIFVVLIIVGFTVYGIIRLIPPDVRLDKEAVDSVISENPELIYAVVLRSNGAEVVASVINKLEQTREYYLLWDSILEAVSIIVPKRLWPDKPEANSYLFGTYFFSDDLRYYRGYDQDVWGGISPTSVGHFYWIWGWAGVVIGHLVLGCTARIAYNTFTLNLDNNNILIVYAIIYTTFIMFAEAIQGYLNSLVMNGMVLVFTFIILHVRLRKNECARR